jgi:hypothetical protein
MRNLLVKIGVHHAMALPAWEDGVKLTPTLIGLLLSFYLFCGALKLKPPYHILIDSKIMVLLQISN